MTWDHDGSAIGDGSCCGYHQYHHSRSKQNVTMPVFSLTAGCWPPWITLLKTGDEITAVVSQIIVRLFFPMIQPERHFTTQQRNRRRK
jgi:hypothetical protein